MYQVYPPNLMLNWPYYHFGYHPTKKQSGAPSMTAPWATQGGVWVTVARLLLVQLVRVHQLVLVL
jgi:hypothetical protein